MHIEMIATIPANLGSERRSALVNVVDAPGVHELPLGSL
jgi:hypothetical protein